MALTDVDPNLSGRESRTSHLSSSQKDASTAVAASRNDVFSPGSSVLGMLKTTTESGDIGAFAVNSSRLRKATRPAMLPRQGSNAGAAQSRTSSHYSRAGSTRSRTSDHNASERPMPGTWPSYSQDSQLDVPNARPLGPALSRGGLRALAITASEIADPDQRSYSLTNTLASPRHLGNNRSVSSLNSYGPGPRSSSPYQYPARLRRLNGRPASPALSDSAGAAYHQKSIMRTGPGCHAYSTSPIPHQRAYFPNGHARLRGQVSMSEISRSTEGLQRAPVAPRRMIQPYYVAGPDPHRAHQPIPPFSSQPMQPRPSQQWRAFPSPLSQNQTIEHHRPHFMGPPAPKAAPYVGFVQRVKNILEERASSEESNRRNILRDGKRRAYQEREVVEERAELAASPVAKRLTRDMIKAAVDTCSDAGQPSSPGGFDTIVSNLQPEAVPQNGTATQDMQPKHATELAAEIDPYVAPESSVSEVTSLESSIGNHSQALASSKSESLPDVTYAEEDQTPSTQSETSELDLSPSSPGLQNKTMPQNADRAVSLPPKPQQKPPNESRLRKSLPGPKELAQRPPAELPQRSPGLGELTNGAIGEKVSFKDEKESDSAKGPPQSAYQETGPTNTANLAKRTHSSMNALKIPMPANIESEQSALPSTYNLSGKRRGGVVAVPVPASSTQRSSLRFSTGSERLETGMIPSWNISNTDLRLSAMKQFHFPLPDLTEDSQEDASTTNLRMLGAKPPAFRNGDQRVPRPTSRPISRAMVVPELPKTYLSNNPCIGQGIPSLEFSNADLTTSLNHALGLRSSRSLEDIRQRMPTDLDVLESQTERPASSTGHRERYKSFFVRVEEIESDEDEEENIDEEHEEEQEILTVQHLKLTEPRNKSMDEELITELKRLSIPSVSGLTLRLSELIPTIKKGSSALDLTKSEENVTSTLTEIRELGSPERLGSTDFSRTSAGSSSHLAVPSRKDTVQSSRSAPEAKALADRTTLRLDKELPSLPAEAGQNRLSITSAPAGLPIDEEYENKTKEICELEATVPLDLTSKPKSQNLEIGIVQHKVKLKRPSNMTLRTLTPERQPWNQESSYTWGLEAPAIEIRMPDPGARENGSPNPRGRYRIKRSRSTVDIPHADDIVIARNMSPGPNMEATLWPQAEGPDELCVDPKRGILGSLSRKMGIKPRVDKAGFPIDPLFLHPEDRLPITEPGDRYPTTGLTPPSGLSIELNRSYFSDDSSESERHNTGTLRKRWTRLKPKRYTQRTASPGDQQTDSQNDQGGTSSIFVESNVDAGNPDILILYDRTPAGMSKIEFRAKRVYEKLRFIWFKSGEVIRGMSKKHKPPRTWYEANELFPEA